MQDCLPMRAVMVVVSLCWLAPMPAAAQVAGDVKTTAEFDRRLTPLVCARAVRCGTIGASELGECLKGERKSKLSSVWGVRRQLGIDKLWKRGHYRVELRGSGACLRWWKTAGCRTAHLTAPKHCFEPVLRSYLRANVKPGGRCKRWDSCVGGFCSSQAGCTGRCKAYSKPGAFCGSNQICDKEHVCHRGKCVSRVGAGGSCGQHWNDCKQGLHCAGFRPAVRRGDPHNRRRMQLGRCKPRPTIGQACGVRADKTRCAPGLFCDNSLAKPICRSPIRRNATCRWPSSCGDGQACIGLTLGGPPRNGWQGVTRSGVCLKHLDVGRPCRQGAYTDGCPRSTRCDIVSKTCVRKKRVGDRCTGSCGGLLYCHRRTRRCTRRLPIGSRCLPARSKNNEPCYIGTCNRRSRRCTASCGRR